MSRDKQISEMACDMCTVIKNCNDPYNPIKTCEAYKCAKIAYEKGYRKASEVAREIFEEIEKTAMSKIDTDLSIAVLNDTYYIEAIDELKKKYIGKDTNVTTNTEET